MYRVGVISLVGYRAWTDGLGDDREWIIQSVQSGLHGILSAEAAALGAHAIPLRYDYMLVLDPGTEPDGVRRIASALAPVAPTPVAVSAACAPTPLEAQARASSSPALYESCAPDPLAAVHMDLDDASSRTRRDSAYGVFEDALRLLCEASRRASSLGGLAQYLGGDNVIAFLPLGALREFMEFVEGLEGVKAGVGVHRAPREAVALAAANLRRIRSSRRGGR
ncbi:MAG: GTP cyclohydrolase IIa [Conexivisphaera sp.]